ncbi:hypothetical protein BRD00_07200 [Halobacteriales archaeon QS_8_69_26]|nr:MAG: hypothetical protein BRD00_07200 [Halobacteriales archaeon QS_8_69_26]
MERCPRCGADLETFSLWGREQPTCPECSYVGVSVHHGSDREDPESWQTALERFREKGFDGPDPAAFDREDPGDHSTEDANGSDPDGEDGTDPGDANGSDPEGTNGSDPEGTNGSDPESESGTDPAPEDGSEPRSPESETVDAEGA